MYDHKCYQLAKDFLEDHPDKDSEENRQRLAQFVQTEIEDHIEYDLQPKPEQLV